MAKQELGFVKPLNLAIALNAATPDPGGVNAIGCIVWSTTTSSFLYWNGTNWVPVDTTGAGGSASISVATITAPYGSSVYAETVTNASVTAASKIILFAGTYSDLDVNSVEHEDISAVCKNMAAGSFQIQLESNSKEKFGGTFKFNYLIG